MKAFSGITLTERDFFRLTEQFFFEWVIMNMFASNGLRCDFMFLLAYDWRTNQLFKLKFI